MSFFDNFLDLLNKKDSDEDIEAALRRSSKSDAYLDEYMRRYDDAEAQFEDATGLNATDLSLIILASALQILRWSLMRNDVGRLTARESDRVFDRYSSYLPTLGDILSDHHVPYDATRKSEHFLTRYGDVSLGFGGGSHRYRTLGHDPLAGLIFGPASIVTNTVTVADAWSGFPSYEVRNNMIYDKTNIADVLITTKQILFAEPEKVAAGLVKTIIHNSTDVFTKLSLPLPVVSSLSPETARFLAKSRVDIYSVSRSAVLSLLVDRIIVMLHRISYQKGYDKKKLYKVRTYKVLMYSHILSTSSNLLYVALSKDYRRLDFGGILAGLYHFLSNRQKIRQVKAQFITNVLHASYQREEEQIDRELEALGIRIDF